MFPAIRWMRIGDRSEEIIVRSRNIVAFMFFVLFDCLSIFNQLYNSSGQRNCDFLSSHSVIIVEHLALWQRIFFVRTIEIEL